MLLSLFTFVPQAGVMIPETEIIFPVHPIALRMCNRGFQSFAIA